MFAAEYTTQILPFNTPRAAVYESQRQYTALHQRLQSKVATL